MDIVNSLTLSKYLKSKLGMSLKDYALLDGVPVRTLSDQWNSETGNIRIQRSVLYHYLKRFGI